MLQLSEDQEAAITKIEKWQLGQFTGALGPNELALAGLAGTGKTTVLTELVALAGKEGSSMKVRRVLAPTGKAAHVLRTKGVDAGTIHSAIYNFEGTELEKETGKVELKFSDKNARFRNGIVVVDESSMVSADVAADLRRACQGILWVGDHGQLPPVGSDPGIMRRADVVLERIHRQAAGSKIVQAAHSFRSGGTPQEAMDVAAACSVGSFDVLRLSSRAMAGSIVAVAVERGIEQLIVPWNDLRWRANYSYRMALKLDEDGLAVGERLVCLRNNYPLGVWNGEQIHVTEIFEWDAAEKRGTVTIEADGRDNPIQCDIVLEEKDAPPREVDRGELLVGYGYAVTCHKAQGSEWKSVLVVDPGAASKFDLPRWRYTAATRAKESLIVVV